MEPIDTNEKLGFLDISILILSVYVLISLLIDAFIVLPVEVSKLLTIIDDSVCAIFLYDFIKRFCNAECKLSFLKWGWIDFISSPPTLTMFRYGRLLRLFRLLRVLRAFRSVKYLMSHLFKSRIQGTFKSVALIAVLMIIFGSISILQFEKSPESNIKSAEDAFWWAFVTITTVGYGDKFPVTSEGRIIAGLLMLTVWGYLEHSPGLSRPGLWERKKN